MANLASEAIIVGEDWISEHYLTTDARSQSFQARVLDRRKAWDEQDADGGESVRTKFLSRRANLVAELAAISPDADLSTEKGSVNVDAARALGARIRSTLGFAGGLDTIVRRGPVEFVSLHGLTGTAPLVVIDAIPVAQVEDLLEKDEPTLLEPFTSEDDDSHEETSTMRLLSRLFADADHPNFALVLAGRWVLLAERERWFEGRYLAIDLQLVCERNDAKRGGEIDRALACIDAASLAPDADGDIWWTATLEDSIKHTVGVSQDLREGVRESIELIANEVVARRLSRGLEALPASQAQVLAKQSLRFLYRILFLLYAEASPQLKVLPVGAAEYENGYSLDRLRELTLVELASDAAQHGTHFYDSLDVLFRMVDQGHAPADVPKGWGEGLQFESLRADLFTPAAVSLISEVKLGDAALQSVLSRLLLSKESRGRDRGYISYADLGINQLGAVYEGLMSYTGFFAETELYEVAPEGDPAKGSWVVPTDRDTGIEAKHYVKRTNETTGAPERVVHAEGSFVFRLAGRERQQSASYYTPEVLTQFTVSQALEELLDQDGVRTSAADILTLTICEPALGSGAFAIEAVRQLGAQYLKRRQDELGTRIDPDEYPAELQKVKASIALHQVYGVDLNATAVEFAEITLWLDTMSEGLRAPWFGLHLKRGNSLIGARRAIYSRSDVSSKAWVKKVPTDAPLFDQENDGPSRAGVNGAIHHFLLPADGWGSAVNAKEAQELAPEVFAELKSWRRGILAKPSKQQLDAIVSLSHRVERLWDFARRRLEMAESEIRRDIPIWGRNLEGSSVAHTVSREEIEVKLGDPDGAYQRLRLVMDAWCALWFWPLTKTPGGSLKPPTLDEWIATLRGILGEHTTVRGAAARHGQATLSTQKTGWEALNAEERDDLAFASVSSIVDVKAAQPWLDVVMSVADQEGFFHWELDFATIFAEGGFDLQLGNPPWVRPDWSEAAQLAEDDAWWALENKPSAKAVAGRRTEALSDSARRSAYLDALVGVTVVRTFVSDERNFPILMGLRPDLYRCFMEGVWARSSSLGVMGLVHPESHFTDERAGGLRRECFRRLRRHWGFINELKLFDIHHLVSYGVHIYGRSQKVGFSSAASLFHPQTAVASMRHDGSGAEPGTRDVEGHWDLRPHKQRIIFVSDTVLASWHALLESSSTPIQETRMVFATNATSARLVSQIASQPRISSLGLKFAQGWNETSDFKAGTIIKNWGVPAQPSEVIIQGPNIHIGNAYFKYPNVSMRNNSDWDVVSLDTLPATALPTTSYKPNVSIPDYLARYTHWANGALSPADRPRIVWRKMAANAGSRTLIAALVPEGFLPTHGLVSAGFEAHDELNLAYVQGVMTSLLSDFQVRVSPKANVVSSVVNRLAMPQDIGSFFRKSIALRSLRLGCLTDSFASLWRNAFDEVFLDDSWAGGLNYEGRPILGEVQRDWTAGTPLRRASDRRQALLEIDVLVALGLGVSADDLVKLYQSEFPILRGYDERRDEYDSSGRLSSSAADLLERPRQHLDREADMRQAYAHFERVLAERS